MNALSDAHSVLSNRRGSQARMDMAHDRRTEKYLVTGGIMIDINPFKQVKDRLGHEDGCEVLRAEAAS